MSVGSTNEIVYSVKNKCITMDMSRQEEDQLATFFKLASKQV